MVWWHDGHLVSSLKVLNFSGYPSTSFLQLMHPLRSLHLPARKVFAARGKLSASEIIGITRSSVSRFIAGCVRVQLNFPWCSRMAAHMREDLEPPAQRSDQPETEHRFEDAKARLSFNFPLTSHGRQRRKNGPHARGRSDRRRR